MTHVRRKMDDMSTATDERIPDMSLGWRLRMSQESAEVSRKALAEHLGVDPGTITRWTHDKGSPPKRAYLIQWAMMTGVPVEWLEHGATGGGNDGPDGGQKTEPYIAQIALAAA